MAASKREVIDLRKTLSEDPVLYLSKLVWELSEILSRPYVRPAERIFLSVNAAESAWHIHEWLWKTTTDAGRKELLRVTKATGNDFKHFVQAVQRWSPAIGICRQLATAHKHFSISHDRPDIYVEVEHDDEREEFATSVTIFANGESYPDCVVYENALVSWGRLYVHLGYEHAEAVRSTAPESLTPWLPLGR